MSNKTAVITGGEGSMAKAIAAMLVKDGAVTLALTPGRAVLDITNNIMVKEYMGFHVPDILINCAGYIRPSPIGNTSLAIWNAHFAVNVTGAFLCSKFAQWAGCKTIINIGSTSAFEGRENWGAYCASKAALISLTETLAEEGIDAYSINPARTATKMRQRLFPNEDTKTLMPPEVIAGCVLNVLQGQFSLGSHIIVGKDFFHVVSKRRCPK